ncbi:phage tail protein [Azospirillum canadense]|uniref:phage tail protein n=1 Tax=Azospirillum canadense TaxID=403962 RepID=UPI0022266256|nr:tail fiber protein [Azospirillum canadense]MCW2238364.1 microcystin-dependent protein [Azospirillum canadense]
MGDAMLGTILIWPIRWVPVGWHLCDGALLNIQQYAALYSLIGTIYGGNGSSTFGLPDLRNRVPVGAQAVTGLNGVAFGATNVAANVTSTGTIQAANLPQHTHTAGFTPTTGPVNFTIPATTGNLTVNTTLTAVAAPTAGSQTVAPADNSLLAAGIATTGTNAPKVYVPAGTAGTTASLGGIASTPNGTPSTPALSGTVTAVNGGSVSVQPAGNANPVPFAASGQVALNVTQPSLYMNFIICIEGLYPQRN